MQSEAETVAAEFKDYAYSVSHDLSAPVRAMVQFSHLLTQEHAEQLDEEAREYFSLIIENGERLEQMMRGLLDYSRLNTMAKPFDTVDCAKLIQGCELALSKNYPAFDRLTIMGSLPTIEADAEQIGQLFAALLDNACKFQPKEASPKIKVSAIEQEDEWSFAITDNGIGIDPKFHSRIFKPFQRLHSEEEYPGVGEVQSVLQQI